LVGQFLIPLIISEPCMLTIKILRLMNTDHFTTSGHLHIYFSFLMKCLIPNLLMFSKLSIMLMPYVYAHVEKLKLVEGQPLHLIFFRASRASYWNLCYPKPPVARVLPFWPFSHVQLLQLFLTCRHIVYRHCFKLS